MDRDAALLAATFAEREDVMEDVEVVTDKTCCYFMKIVMKIYFIKFLR